MKKQVKKLSLSRETLSNLDRSAMRNAAGDTAVDTACGGLNCSATRVCSGCHPCA